MITMASKTVEVKLLNNWLLSCEIGVPAVLHSQVRRNRKDWHAHSRAYHNWPMKAPGMNWGRHLLQSYLNVPVLIEKMSTIKNHWDFLPQLKVHQFRTYYGFINLQYSKGPSNFRLMKGTIHKRCQHFFPDFWHPSPPCWQLWPIFDLSSPPNCRRHLWTAPNRIELIFRFY